MGKELDPVGGGGGETGTLRFVSQDPSCFRAGLSSSSPPLSLALFLSTLNSLVLLFHVLSLACSRLHFAWLFFFLFPFFLFFSFSRFFIFWVLCRITFFWVIVWYKNHGLQRREGCFTVISIFSGILGILSNELTTILHVKCITLFSTEYSRHEGVLRWGVMCPVVVANRVQSAGTEGSTLVLVRLILLSNRKHCFLLLLVVVWSSSCKHGR